MLGPSPKPVKPGDQVGAVVAANHAGGAAASEQPLSDVDRNVMLKQQREQLQAQLVLQQQLHNELEQHLRLQQEHHQLQAQLMASSDAGRHCCYPGMCLKLQQQCYQLTDRYSVCYMSCNFD